MAVLQKNDGEQTQQQVKDFAHQFAKLVVVWPQINRQIKLEMYKAMHNGQAPASAEDME